MLLAEIRDYLARFLFTGEDVFKKVEVLSGGERGRLALAKLSLAHANLLLLDEPTNHLDIPSQEILQEVLIRLPGHDPARLARPLPDRRPRHADMGDR